MSKPTYWHALDIWLSDSGYFFRFAVGEEQRRGVDRFVIDDAGEVVGVRYLPAGGPNGTLDLVFRDIDFCPASWTFIVSGFTVFVFLTWRLREGLSSWRERWPIDGFAARVPWREAGQFAEYVSDLEVGDGCVLQPREDS